MQQYIKGLMNLSSSEVSDTVEHFFTLIYSFKLK